MKSQNPGHFLLLSIVLLLFHPASATPDILSDSLYWVPVSHFFPEAAGRLDVVEDTLGWICTGSKHLYTWNGHNLEPIPQLPNEEVLSCRAIGANDVWASIHLKDQYRYCLKYFNGEKWRYVKTPNTTPIYDLAFPAPDAGWVVCQWGEILHFNGEQWIRAASPTNYHLTHIAMPTPDLGWIAGQNRGKGILLQYQAGDWKIRHFFEKGEPQFILATNDSTVLAVIWEDYLKIYRITPAHCEKILLPSRKNTAGRKPVYNFFEFKQHLCCFFPETREFFLYHKNEWKILPWGIMGDMRDFAYARNHLLFTKRWQLFQLKKYPSGTSISQIIPFQKNDIQSRFEYGVAVGDVNNDNQEDLYIVNHEGVNRLVSTTPAAENAFLKGGALAAEADISGQTWRDENKQHPTIYDSGVSMADIDNDGDQDLYLCSMYQPNILYKNNGWGKFRDFTEDARVGGPEMAFSELGVWGDVDNDGNIDLFVANKLSSNKLYLNDGTGRFRDVTATAGLSSSWGSQNPAFCDFDNDGDLDLFIAHNAGKIKLMCNVGVSSDTPVPRFVDVTSACGLDTSIITDCRCGIWGDVDNDGDLDLFLTLAWLPDKLYLNNGQGFFEDVSVAAGFVDSTNSRGALFFDADNDGLLDLFVGQGGPNLFYHNQGHARFVERAADFGLDGTGSTTGIVALDLGSVYQQDGQLDLYVARMDVRSMIYHNRSEGNSYLRFRLIGIQSNRDAVGARVFLYDAGYLSESGHFHGVREVQAGGGYNSMSSKIVHFGVKPDKKYDVLIRFPAGNEVILYDVAAGQLLEIYEQQGYARWLSELKRWVMRTLKDPDNHRQSVFFCFLALVVFGFYRICRKKSWGNSTTRSPLLVLPFTLYILIKIISPIDKLWLFDGVSLAAALVLAGVLLWYNYFFSRQINREDLMLQLLMLCRAFEHSHSLASYMNQLKLVFSNINPRAALSRDVINLIYEAVSNFYQYIFQDVQRIIDLTRRIFPDSKTSTNLKNQIIALSGTLDEIKIQINLKKQIESNAPQTIRQMISGIQKELQSVCARIDLHFSAPLHQNLDKMIENFSQPGLVIEKSDLVQDPEILVRIRQSELVFVLENLFTNALHALQNRLERKIRISIKQLEQRVTLSFEDNGCGIPSEIRDKIFKHGVSSKTGGRGGFGLYNSKLLLTKYGGNIYLKNSETGKGSRFVVVLKRIG